MPDYTKQLDEIVRLLGRPGISPWVLANFAALLGVIGGAVGRALEPWIADFWRRARMRRVLFGDVASMFSHVDTITSYGVPRTDNYIRDMAFDRLKRVLDFEAEEHIKTKSDVFMQLRERVAAKHIYHLLHQIVSDGAAEMERNCEKVQWMLGKYIRDGELHEKYFRKYLRKDEADRLIRRATEFYDRSIKAELERQKESEKHLST